MKNSIQFYSFFFLFILTVFAFQSCKEKVEILFESPQLIMYTPTSDIDGVSMKFVWSTVPNANYIFQISTDNYVTDIDTLVFDKDITTASVTGLTSNILLYARIKAVSKDGSVKYADFRNSTLFLSENVFSNSTSNIVNATDITATSIKLAWLSDRHVTSIIKTTGNTSDTTQLTAGDLSAKNKTFTSLLAKTKYSFKILKNKTLRGTVTATTKAN